MALSDHQRRICRVLAELRKSSGEGYVAGGVALNELLGTSRRSEDVDLFHDSEEAVAVSWDRDRRVLRAEGFAVTVLRERPSFVEARVERAGDVTLLQWTRDSAYRFFPLIEHPDFGLALHPFDLATNKVLALVGRLEVRDWIDVLECDRRLQGLGYLAWAACGKDPGFGPGAILEQAGRSSRYSSAEVAALSFEGPVPDATALSASWRAALEQARETVAMLPSARAGECVLLGDELCRLTPAELRGALERDEVRFHAGSIGGAWPSLRS